MDIVTNEQICCKASAVYSSVNLTVQPSSYSDINFTTLVFPVCGKKQLYEQGPAMHR